MKDYRPLLSDVAGLIEEVLDSGVLDEYAHKFSYQQEDVVILFDKINDMFDEIDNEYT